MLLRNVLLFIGLLLWGHLCSQTSASEPRPSGKPSAWQWAQIHRKYGMFIHFGINTFCDQEWTDGHVPAATYHPGEIDADQWVRVAKSAGMKYVILVTKHVDGFCLWDSHFTRYDVAASGCPVNVVEKVALACKKYHIGLGLYYSLWDRHQNGDLQDTTLDSAYNRYMIRQLRELILLATRYTPVVELWLDGGWEKKRSRWPIREIYQTVKGLAPGCQVGVNWSIGTPENPDPDSAFVLPSVQQQGYPIRYFPSDFRMGDPYLPATPDPKLFSHNGHLYYMPFETTMCISRYWFYNTRDTADKPVSELLDLYRKATAQDNIFILDVPPDRTGHLRDGDIRTLLRLHTEIDRLPR